MRTAQSLTASPIADPDSGFLPNFLLEMAPLIFPLALSVVLDVLPFPKEGNNIEHDRQNEWGNERCEQLSLTPSPHCR